MTAISVFTIIAGVLAVATLAVYLFGIPPEAKRKLERSALKTMGENKLSYMAKDQISKLPASDQKDFKNLQKGLGNAVGGLANNPLGEATGRAATQAWDSVEDFSKILLERVGTMAKNAKEGAEQSRPWDSVEDFSKILLERVTTMGRNAKDAATSAKDGAAKKAEEVKLSVPVQKAKETAEGYTTAQE